MLPLLIIVDSDSNILLTIFEQIAIDKLQTRMDKNMATKDKAKQEDLDKLSARKDRECNSKLATLTRKYNKHKHVVLSNHQQQLKVCLLLFVSSSSL